MREKENKLEFYRASSLKKVLVPYFEGGVAAGFPSPAEDYTELKLDLNEQLIKNKDATFFARVRGKSMLDAGLSDGDILVVDRSQEPCDGKIAVCFIDGEFTVKRIRVEDDMCWLVPENSEFKPIKVTEENDFVVWGMVTYVIKQV